MGASATGTSGATLTQQQLSGLSDEQFASLVYNKALQLYNALVQHTDSAYAQAMANVINQKFLNLPAGVAQQLALTTPETLDQIEEYGDLLMKVGEVFKGSLEKIALTADNAALQNGVKTATVNIWLQNGWSLCIRDTNGQVMMAIFQGRQIPVTVTWFDQAALSENSTLLSKLGVASGKALSFLEIGSRLCHTYERVSGALNMYKGLVSYDAAGSLTYIKGALQFVGAGAPVYASLAITWYYCKGVEAAARMIQGIERGLIVQYLDNLLKATQDPDVDRWLQHVALGQNATNVPFGGRWFGNELAAEYSMLLQQRQADWEIDDFESEFDLWEMGLDPLDNY